MRTRAIAVAAALALALTACSDGADDGADGTTSPDEAAAADGTVRFVGTASLRWQDEDGQTSAVLADDGSLAVTIACDGAVPHNVVLEGVNDDAVIAECAGDDSATATLEVEPGTYTYYCAIPGHRNAGMEGEVTIS